MLVGYRPALVVCFVLVGYPLVLVHQPLSVYHLVVYYYRLVLSGFRLMVQRSPLRFEDRKESVRE